MVRLPRLTLSLALVWSSSACAAPELLGTWQSDQPRSTEFNAKHAKLLPRTERFLSDLMGQLSLSFTQDQVHWRAPDIHVEIEGKNYPIVGLDERHAYTLLYENAEMAAIATFQPGSGKSVIKVLNFVDDDHFWIYSDTASTPSPLGDVHVREFFRRVKE